MTDPRTTSPTTSSQEAPMPDPETFPVILDDDLPEGFDPDALGDDDMHAEGV